MNETPAATGDDVLEILTLASGPLNAGAIEARMQEAGHNIVGVEEVLAALCEQGQVAAAVGETAYGQTFGLWRPPSHLYDGVKFYASAALADRLRAHQAATEAAVHATRLTLAEAGMPATFGVQDDSAITITTTLPGLRVLQAAVAAGLAETLAATVDDGVLVCPHCGTRDDIVEIDSCVRRNPVRVKAGGREAAVDPQERHFASDGFECESCRGPVHLPLPVGWAD